MQAASDFVFGQIRLQARYGDRVREPAWRTLESSVDVAQYLHLARATSLRRWIERIEPASSARRIERELRSQWRELVDEITRWQPQAWRSATAWLRYLVDLPVYAHLLSDAPPATWLRDDPEYRTLALPTREERRKAFAHEGLAALVDDTSRPPDVLDAWVEEWRRHWPAGSQHRAAELEHLIGILSRHRHALLSSSVATRQALEDRLAFDATRMFRCAAESPAAVAAWLVLTALQFGRLRRGLVLRTLHAQLNVAEQ